MFGWDDLVTSMGERELVREYDMVTRTVSSIFWYPAPRITLLTWKPFDPLLVEDNKV